MWLKVTLKGDAGFLSGDFQTMYDILIACSASQNWSTSERVIVSVRFCDSFSEPLRDWLCLGDILLPLDAEGHRFAQRQRSYGGFTVDNFPIAA